MLLQSSLNEQIGALYHIVRAGVSLVLWCPEDIEDTTQEAAFNLARYWQRYDATRGTRESWAFEIGRKAALAHRRTQTRRERILARIDLSDGLAHDDLEHTVLTRVFAQEVCAQLTDKERRYALLLAAGYMPGEAAAAIGVNYTTTRGWLLAARARLEQEWA